MKILKKLGDWAQSPKPIYLRFKNLNFLIIIKIIYF